MSNETTTADGGVRKKGKLGQRIAYACGNLGQSAFYNAMSTYFIVYVTGCLFSGVDKALAAKLIGVITSLVVIIRIAEKHNATAAQVILAWAMGEGYAVIPSSTKRENLASNLLARDLQLDDEDNNAIAALECNDRLVSPEGLAPDWD